MNDEIDITKFSAECRDELARLLVKAKGGGRTMKQFADECGVYPSTLSRIVNKQNNGPSKEELIRSIAEHADPESGVTLEALMRANRKLKKDEAPEMPEPAQISGSSIDNQFKRAMIYELEKNEDLIEEIEGLTFTIGTTFRFSPDFSVLSKSVKGASGLWAFDLLVPSSPSVLEKSGRDISTYVYGRRIIERMGTLLSMFYSNKEQGVIVGKFSFGVIGRKLFDCLKAEFKNYCLPFNVSLILFNPDKDAIEDEFVFEKPERYDLEFAINNY